MRAPFVPALVLAVVAALAGAAPGHAADQIGSGSYPSIVVDREATSHVVWNESRPGSTDRTHYCRIPRGATACGDGSRVFGGHADTYDVWGPNVMITPFGEVFVLTHRCCSGDFGTGSATANLLYTSEDDGLTFTGPHTLGDVAPGTPGEPSRSVLDPADRRIVTISPPTGGVRVQGAPIDGFTTAKAQLTDENAGTPTIVQRGRGSFAAAWEHGNGDRVVVRTYDCPECPLGDLNAETNWSEGATIDDATLPILTSGPGGTFLVYRSTADDTDRQWFVRRVEGASLGPPSVATPPSSGSVPRDAFQDPRGRLHFVYKDANEALVHRSSGDATAWTEPHTLVPGPDFAPHYPRLGVASGDAGFTGRAVWVGGNTDNQPILFDALPEPPADPAPPGPPPEPPPEPPPGGGPTGPPPTGDLTADPCRVLQFASVDVLADTCLRRDGDTYVATGRLLVNGLGVVPAGGGQVRIDTGDRRITSSGAVTLFLGDTLLSRERLDWRLERGNTSDVPPVEAGEAGGKLLGFSLAGVAELELRRGAVELKLTLGLPEPFDEVTGEVVVRADNLAGVHLRSLKVEVGTVFLGALEVKDLSFEYEPDERAWSGEAEVVLPPQPPGPSLAAGIGFKEGELDFLRGEAVLPGAGIPLDPLSIVYLNRIRFALRTNPQLALTGGIGLTAGPAFGGTGAIRIDGDLTFGVPEPPLPAFLRVDGRVYVVDVQLGSGYFEMRMNGYAGFGGELDYELAGFGAKGTLDGWIYGLDFNVEAAVEICLGDLGCEGGRVVVSSVGFAGCAETPIADFGAGYKWGEFIDLMFTGCDIGPYRAVMAQAGGPQSVRFGPGLPSGFVGVRSTDGSTPPRVALIGPEGQRIEPPADGPLRTPDAIAFHTPDGTTWFVLRRPAAGEWRVEELPGSAPVERVLVADGLPKPSVHASVKRRGTRRILRYSVRPLPNQRVWFAEIGRGAAREIGVARGRRGRIAFKPLDGPGGRRQIVAVVESSGTPRASLPVAGFTAPPPRPPAKPRRLRAKRRGGAIALKWRRAARAARYMVRVRTADGRRFLVPARRPRVRIPAVGRRTRATVGVFGLKPDGTQGRATTLTVRAR